MQTSSWVFPHPLSTILLPTTGVSAPRSLCCHFPRDDIATPKGPHSTRVAFSCASSKGLRCSHGDCARNASVVRDVSADRKTWNEESQKSILSKSRFARLFPLPRLNNSGRSAENVLARALTTSSWSLSKTSHQTTKISTRFLSGFNMSVESVPHNGAHWRHSVYDMELFVGVSQVKCEGNDAC